MVVAIHCYCAESWLIVVVLSFVGVVFGGDPFLPSPSPQLTFRLFPASEYDNCAVQISLIHITLHIAHCTNDNMIAAAATAVVTLELALPFGPWLCWRRINLSVHVLALPSTPRQQPSNVLSRLQSTSLLRIHHIHNVSPPQKGRIPAKDVRSASSTSYLSRSAADTRPETAHDGILGSTGSGCCVDWRLCLCDAGGAEDCC
jgi:hypothetical protein